MNESQVQLINTTGLLLSFPIEGTAKFQLKVGENKDIIFFPLQVHQHLKFYPWIPWRFCGL